MTNQEITELIAVFDRSTALTLRLVREGFSLELTRGGPSAPPALAPAREIPAAEPKAAGDLLRAPLAGIYHSAAPERGPFVRSGERVQKGQTVCLIEAMKMMSEVTASCDCVIEELLQTDGALLSFDAPILRYRAV